MKTIEDKNNEMLNRRELKVIVKAEKNPGFPDASKLISEHFKSPEEMISVKEIKGKFGRDTFLISARIYKNKEDFDFFEKKKEKKQAGGSK